MCAFYLNIFIIISEPHCFCARILWIKQRSSLVTPNIVTKLQSIRIETELVYIGRRRTTPFNENDTWVNKNWKNMYNASNKRENLNSLPKACHFLGPPCIVCFFSTLLHPPHMRDGLIFIILRFIILWIRKRVSTSTNGFLFVNNYT